MATKLEVYNLALGYVRERKIADLTEDREPRRLLDDVWDHETLMCLENGQWVFAFRSLRMDSSPSVDPAFGYRYAFELPDDRSRIVGVSASETFDPPLNAMQEEAGYIFADIDPLYLMYVSKDVGYGMNIGEWPALYTDYVAHRLAVRIAPRVTHMSGEAMDELAKSTKRARSDALSSCAMQSATKFMPVGSWVLARSGGRVANRRYDRA